jgi:hypothetical protein
MTDNKEKKDEDKAISALEAEGIVIENIALKKELEENLSTPPTKEEEEKLFEAMGVEIPKTTIEPAKPETATLKKELDRGGIEVLPTKPLEDDLG